MNLLLIFPGFILAFIIVLYYKRKIRRTGPRNKVHFYVAREKDGRLWLYLGKPKRRENYFSNDIWCISDDDLNIKIFKALNINPKHYDTLQWHDDPVEVFPKIKD